MRVDRDTTPSFQPVTITLDTVEEAQALKVLCTTTAEDAVLNRDRGDRTLAVSEDAIRQVSGSIFRALKAEGVSYLNPKV